MKFFTYSQNNSGGYYIQNDDVEEYLVIEASDFYEADIKMYEITSEYSEYCDCCGERWNGHWFEDEGTDEPEIYGEPVFEQDRNCIIYHTDGRKQIVRPFE